MAAQISDSLLRLSDIIGNRAEGIPAIIPVSAATWWRGVRDGRFPQPVRIGKITAWRSSDINAVIRKTVADASPQLEKAEA